MVPAVAAPQDVLKVFLKRDFDVEKFLEISLEDRFEDRFELLTIQF